MLGCGHRDMFYRTHEAWFAIRRGTAIEHVFFVRGCSYSGMVDYAREQFDVRVAKHIREDSVLFSDTDSRGQAQSGTTRLTTFRAKTAYPAEAK